MGYPAYLRLLLVAGFLSQASCGKEPTAPATPETLTISVRTRLPAEGETVPTVRLWGGAGNVAIRVTRRALCGTLVSAGISRGTAELAIVARVSSDPLAICIAKEQSSVVDYEGTITSVEPGTYRVRIFEAVANGEPQLIGSATVTVSPPAA